MFENLIEILKANPRKIVYTEGADARILSAAARLKKDGLISKALPFWTRPPIRAWMRWWRKWSSCARAR